MRIISEEEKQLINDTIPWRVYINDYLTINPEAPQEIMDKYNLLLDKYRIGEVGLKRIGEMKELLIKNGVSRELLDSLSGDIIFKDVISSYCGWNSDYEQDWAEKKMLCYMVGEYHQPKALYEYSKEVSVNLRDLGYDENLAIRHDCYDPPTLATEWKKGTSAFNCAVEIITDLERRKERIK